MTVIKIKGGLGNQLFQYAYGRKLAIIDKKEVIFDISFFDSEKSGIDTGRPFLLDKFNVDSSAKFRIVKENVIRKTFKRIKAKITGNYGFYQGEKYFRGVENIIHKEFTLKNSLSKVAQEIASQILKTKDSVSVHIRRGDYVSDVKTNAHHGTCDLSYYIEAIKIITIKITSPTFFVFSDDINWARENLKIDKVVYVSDSEIKDYEELILMSKCAHNIIANSSFSWWGAWLNQNNEKIVIAPKQWTVKKTADELDILPKSWIQI